MVNRVATYPFTNQMIADNMRLQTKYGDVNTQISSGLKSPDYKGISTDSQNLLSLESITRRLTTYNTNSNTVLAHVNTMYDAVGQVIDLANSMITAITAALGGDIVDPTVTRNQADNALQETQSLLNLKIGNRYLFAGSDIETQPVDLTDPAWVAQTTPSTANTTYYHGNSTINAVQSSESMTVTYGVLASNPAFEQLLRAYNLAYNNSTNKTALQEASSLVRQAIDDLATIQGGLSLNAHTLQNQVDQNDKDKVNLTELISSIKDTDIPSASVLLTEVQTQIEASYSASVRVLNLNLHDYLN
ncbi:MAG: flagellin [Alphaproteobacteria bacterium]|nr:flagellin [Alphaproteobacteria bacterium]